MRRKEEKRAGEGGRSRREAGRKGGRQGGMQGGRLRPARKGGREGVREGGRKEEEGREGETSKDVQRKARQTDLWGRWGLRGVSPRCPAGPGIRSPPSAR